MWNIRESNATRCGSGLIAAFVCLSMTASDTALGQGGRGDFVLWQELTGVYRSDAQWGDFDSDGDLDLVISGYTSPDVRVTKTYENQHGTLIFRQDLIGVANDGSGNLAWGDYDGDGDLDLALAGYTDDEDRIAHIYENDGEGNLTWDTQHALTGVSNASVTWGDYDNDGDLDLVITGHDGTQALSMLYRNDPPGVLTPDASITLTGVYSGSADWADYDNDGDLDLILTGTKGAGVHRTIFYENDPVGTLTDIGSLGLPQLCRSDAQWGDYDNDGDLDIAITGDGAGWCCSRVYRNNDGASFTKVADVLDVNYSSCAWGDYDNDGDLDVAFCGFMWADSEYTKIYENTGSGFDLAYSPKGVRHGSMNWADPDGDGDLDFFITGHDNADARYARLYENVGHTLNTPPSPPTELHQEWTADGLLLSWSGASDAETPTDGLYYCLRVGTSPGAHDIVSGTYGSPLMGNVGQATEIVLDLPDGSYHWSVQTIDTGFMASEWATAEEGILHVPDEYPTIQAAIDAAWDGDDVVVSPGIYDESIDLLGKAITVHSSAGADVTTISGYGSVVKCTSGEGCDTIIEGFTITGGGGTYNGGGMENNASDPTVANCVFINNSATRGGGMSNTIASPTVINCAFIDNEADHGGGMSNFFASYPTLIGCTFEANTALLEGGGLNASDDSDVTLEDCTFIGNFATERGGGVYSIGSDLLFTECVFEANSAKLSDDPGGGGGLHCDLSDPVLQRCLFIGNGTTAWGGAVNLIDSASTMIDCRFLQNAANMGGALAYSYADPLVVNGLFAGNTADTHAGAVSSHRSTPAYINCTLVANISPDTGGIRIKQDPEEGGTVIVNSILWGNEDDSGDEQHAQMSMMWADPALVSVDYCDIQGWADLIEGEGNISADPMFIAPNAGDYHLGDYSPCADAADNTALPDDIEFDLDGNPRLVDNPNVEDTGVSEYGDPGVTDMGCYEWQPPECIGDIDGDGVVNVVDLLILLATWGDCPDPGDCFGDLDGNGTVDVIDLMMLLAAWGPCE